MRWRRRAVGPPPSTDRAFRGFRATREIGDQGQERLGEVPEFGFAHTKYLGELGLVCRLVLSHDHQGSAHNTLFPRVVKALKKKGIKDVLVLGGGVIPEDDRKGLIKSGVSEVFGPGTTLSTIIDHVTKGVSKLRK